MTGKFKLAFIMNEKKRKATFKKRTNGLMKKVRELSILCGINICAIVCSPDHVEPVVWPSAMGFQHMISLFLNLPEMEKRKYMFNQVTYLKQRVDKANKKLKKKITQNRQKMGNELLCQCLMFGERRLENLSLSDLNHLGSQTDAKLIEINHRMESSRNGTPLPEVLTSPPQSPRPITLQPVASPMPEIAPPALSKSRLQTLVLMTSQQVPSFQTMNTPEPPLMPMVQQQFAPSLLKPMVPIDQMQQSLTHVQRHNQLPLRFNNWVNHQPVGYMVYGQLQENQTVMPFTNNPNTAWSNAFDPASAHVAQNPHGFFSSY